MSSHQYAFLVNPSANAVYASVTSKLSGAELAIVNTGLLGGKISAIEPAELGGVPYITFTGDALTERDVAALSNLSSIYALFEMRGEALYPTPLKPADQFSKDLITIQKYKGKTNTVFTKLLVNVAIASLDGIGEEDAFSMPLRVLDPMCGRGTTLNQSMMYGFDAYGIEIDPQDFDAYRAFITRWLKDHRLKHALSATTIGINKSDVARLLEIETATDKETFKTGRRQIINLLNADALTVRSKHAESFFDMIVTDLPYGVHHESRDKSERFTRRPLDLLASALPIWTKAVRPGGVIALAWNTRVASRDKLIEILAGQSDLQIMDSEPFQAFRHVVDQAITRDLVIAKRTGASACQ